MPTDHAGGDGRVLYTANVGDSRIYLVRGGALEQLSQDHTKAQQLLDHVGGVGQRLLELLCGPRCGVPFAARGEDRSKGRLQVVLEAREDVQDVEADGERDAHTLTPDRVRQGYMQESRAHAVCAPSP